MSDDGADEEDPWFDRVTNPDTEDTDRSESGPDDEQSVQSTEQWEWVRPADSRSDRTDTEDGKRVWDRFEDARADTPTEKSDRRQRPSENDRPDRGELPPPAPVRDDRSGDADLPPPPPGADGQRGDADAPPGPARRDIREMQPLYKRRSTEFYLMWLVAALSYGLGDMVTTSVVFVTPRVGESNPFVALVIGQFGLVGFVAIKLVIFVILITIGVKGAIDQERLAYYGPPLLAILVGVGLTVWNLSIILGL